MKTQFESSQSADPAMGSTELDRSLCQNCGRHPASFLCSSCEMEACDGCLLTSDVLPESKFCCEVCRNEAEVEAENARLAGALAELHF
jgi:hypothetical protein